MPKAQLQYLTDELNKLREQKLYQKLRVLETEQLPSPASMGVRSSTFPRTTTWG